MARKFNDIIEEKVQEAIKNGVFDDLPGKGKPLKFDDQSMNNENWLVAKVLKNANYLPPWLELDKNIRKAKEELMRILKTHQEWLEAHIEKLSNTEKQEEMVLLERIKSIHKIRKDRYFTLVKEINPQIRKMNFEVPVASLQRSLVKEEEWFQKFEQCQELYLQILATSYSANNLKSKFWIKGLFSKLFRKFL